MRSARPSCSTAFLRRSSASSPRISESRDSMRTCGSRTRFPIGSVAARADSWFVVGRLRPNVTFDQAQAEMSAIARRLDEQVPAAERNRGISVVPLSLYMVGPGRGWRCGCSAARCFACSSSPPPTSRASRWRAASAARARWPFARLSARVPDGSCGSCSPKASRSPRSRACSARCWPSQAFASSAPSALATWLV